ncbi:acetyl-CoA synthetase-like protein [Dendrothele bispora CBS 962.96]|uniref:Acetyl-CoA synthetase-like protein n=1 Tax=Dendrothele bispora (strain CBS 962.96) TaxID=1314807 RepID=A0A4S8LX16_DENBC|nr:acetyl-CoA synthetase-like protein [Dendrothele bispora CBS 962.96]
MAHTTHKRFASLHPRPPLVYTTPQAQQCSGFTVPPLDGSVLNGELIDWHMERSSGYSYAVLLDEGHEEDVYLTYAELGEAIHNLGRRILESIPTGPLDSNGRPKIIALYAALDPLIYTVIILAIIRAGFVPFPLSPRNSQPAIVHLLSITSCNYIIASTGAVPNAADATAMELITQSVLDEMDVNGRSLKVLKPPSVKDIFPRLAPSSLPIPPFVRSEDFRPIPPLSVLIPGALRDKNEWPWMIIHSSGSTKFPKPVYIGQKTGLQQWLTWPWISEMDISGKVQGTLGTPCFHGMGMAMHVGATFSAGAISALWKPRDGPSLSTPEKFLAGLTKSRAQYSVIVPSFLKVWSNEPAAVRVLAGMEVVCYGAGPLSKSVGDKLVEGGVNVQNCYGLTEAGPPFTFLTRRRPGFDWQYGRFAEHVKPRFVPEEEGKYILHLQNCDSHTLPVINVIEDGIQAFNTQDILEEHPTKPGFYRVVGRADDQIIMANGEKTNPGPLELVIQSDPLVNGAFMFGRSRTHAGVAVEPALPINVADPDEVVKFRNAIWPSVERANQLAPQHSRIFKEYILVCDPVNRPLPRTPKGDVQRRPANELYEDNIERIYKAVQEGSFNLDWAKPPQSWDAEGIHTFVEQVIEGTIGAALGRKVDPEMDLFMQGCDSLQAVYIRQAIVTALRQCAPRTECGHSLDFSSKISNNFVYEHPTRRAIEEFLLSIVRDEDIEDTKRERKIAAMRAMVEKYTSDWPVRSTVSIYDYRPAREVVLITGTTGTLGTYLLGSLLEDSRFVRVYALNRGSNLRQRQLDAFHDKGLDVSLLDSAKLKLIEGDTAEPKLGLSENLYDEILNSVTTIIANAWTLNFAMTLSSFESQIKGVRNLVDLALSSPLYSQPQILFSSSVATILGWESDSYIPETSLGPEYALGNGYSESKWVAEQILLNATQTRGLRTCILRIGQLAGSRVNGSWNLTDWVPQIVQSGCALHMLPTFPPKSVVSWLPIDVAAEAFVNAIFQTVYGTRYVNLVHPNPVSWHNLFSEIALSLGNLPLVPYVQWYSALKDVSSKPYAAEKVTAVRILDFFAAGTIDFAANAKREAMGMGMMATDIAKRLCPSLAAASPLSGEDASKWVTYWREHGMFEI